MLSYLLFGGGLFVALMAVIHLAQPQRNMINYYFAAMYSSTGLIVLYAWAERTGIIYNIYLLYNMQIPLCYVFAPLLYYGFSYITYIDHEPAKVFLPHFIPAIVAIIVILTINILNTDIFRSITPVISPVELQNKKAFFAAHLLGLGSNVYILYFLTKSIICGMRFFKTENLKKEKELKLLLAYIIMFYCVILIMGIGHLLHNMDIVHTAKFLSAVTFMLYSFYSFRYPEYTQKVERKIMQIRYKNSQLQGLNTDAVLKHLEYLMKHEKCYEDMELSLSALSELLLITPHQTSEILNNFLNVNFSTYINKFRIDDAKNLLLLHPEITVLQIAFDVGFNSKASFNTNFHKQTGMTPSEYRKSNNPTFPNK